MKSYEDWQASENKATDTENNEIFADKRKVGAADIAEKAKKKGGYAQLTAWHFQAKATPYKEMQKAIERGEPLSFFKTKYNEAMKRLHKSGDKNQKTFQKLIGELEVYGEIYLQVRDNKKY